MLGPVPLLAIAALVLPVAVVAAALVALWPRRHAETTREAWIDGAIIGWLVAVALATLSPLSEFGTFDGRPDVVLEPFDRLPGAPLAYAALNVLLLVPLATLLVLRGRRPRVLPAVLVGVAVSAGIELLQLLHPDRVTNVDDLVLNSVGAVLGALLGLLLRPLRRAPAPRPRAPISWPADEAPPPDRRTGPGSAAPPGRHR